MKSSTKKGKKRIYIEGIYVVRTPHLSMNFGWSGCFCQILSGSQQPTHPHPYPPHRHRRCCECSCTHVQYFPRRQVIQQTLLADWNEERINSRWYHWEKMERNVENAPCLAATGRHDQEREQILGMRCYREAKPMPYDWQSTGTGLWQDSTRTLNHKASLQLMYFY